MDMINFFEAQGKDLQTAIDESKNMLNLPSAKDIVIEAEDADSITPKLQIHQDTSALGGKYIEVPYTPGPQEGEYDRNASGVSEAQYELQILKPGSYVVLSRIIAPDPQSDSFYVSLDDHEERVWDTAKCKTWTWQIANICGEGETGAVWGNVITIADPWVLYLAKGKHILRIRNREDGTKLDTLVIFFVSR